MAGMIDFLNIISRYAIPGLFFIIPLWAFFRKVPVYESFVEGAAEGIAIAVKIFPFLLGILMAIGVFRASGAFAYLGELLSPCCDFFGIPADVLPLALMRPLSGSGALGLTAEILQNSGPDSFTGRLASIMQGSTDTTFYILTVYFGAVGIHKYRYALAVGLGADLISFIMAAIVCHIFFA